MSIKISPIVMAIPERARDAEALAATLNCRVNYDERKAGPWVNARDCWLSTPEDCTHRLVLQDDAVLCPGFMDAVTAAIAARPLDVVSLWSCWPFLLDARVAKLSWVRSQSRCAGIALVMPREWIAPFVAWREQYFDSAWTCCDGPLLLWRVSQGGGFEYTAPSLVQHRADVVSVVNGRPNSETERQSPWFATNGAADVNWHTQTLGHEGRVLRYIAQCVPYLRDGVEWPPGGEPDPRFAQARREPRLFGAHR